MSIPTINSISIKNITASHATLVTSISNTNNSKNTVIFTYGIQNGNQILSDWENKIKLNITSDGSYEINITNLTHNTKYYYNVFITNSKDFLWASAIYFITASTTLPNITINPIPSNKIKSNTASISGFVNDCGGEIPLSATIYYGEIDHEQNISEWEYNISITLPIYGPFNVNLKMLKPNTKYFYIFKIKNSKGDIWI